MVFQANKHNWGSPNSIWCLTIARVVLTIFFWGAKKEETRRWKWQCLNYAAAYGAKNDDKEFRWNQQDFQDVPAPLAASAAFNCFLSMGAVFDHSRNVFQSCCCSRSQLLLRLWASGTQPFVPVWNHSPGSPGACSSNVSWGPDSSDCSTAVKGGWYPQAS
jgi:hypothetical protein